MHRVMAGKHHTTQGHYTLSGALTFIGKGIKKYS